MQPAHSGNKFTYRGGSHDERSQYAAREKITEYIVNKKVEISRRTEFISGNIITGAVHCRVEQQTGDGRKMIFRNKQKKEWKKSQYHRIHSEVLPARSAKKKRRQGYQKNQFRPGI